ncbi:MAG: hypothetical protein AAGB11_14080 [Pseudomonadota bacterium]
MTAKTFDEIDAEIDELSQVHRKHLEGQIALAEAGWRQAIYMNRSDERRRREDQLKNLRAALISLNEASDV